MNIVIFAGAGASKAVSEQYPTTEGFFRDLPDDLRNEGLVRSAADRVEQQGKAPPDIEDILSILDDLQASVEPFLNIDVTPGWYLANGRFKGSAPGGGADTVLAFARKLTDTCGSLRETI